MAILVDKDTRLLVQGITGREGGYHTDQMREFGTNVVAGVTPGRGGSEYKGVPVFDSVSEAVTQTGANASIVFVPPPFAGDAILESAAAGLALTVCITEGVPTLDAVKAVRYLEGKPTRLVGPNCPGLTTPQGAKVGIMPSSMFDRRGRVGVVSRSGTLTYEAASLLTERGIGISTCIGIGGDPVIGSTFIDVLRLFNSDEETEQVLLIGEIGGSDEETAAAYIRSDFKKDVYAFISGRSAPPGKRMGHAGAIISGGMGTPQAKVTAFQEAGVVVADTLSQMVDLLQARVKS
jgi:succinyl-CoA synthetase alpha subunit